MKVIVLWDKPDEESRARNLVKVLKAIGTMLIYGKVKPEGVQLENWQGQPPVNLECVAGPAPSAIMPKPGETTKLADLGLGSGGFSTELQYRDGGYYTNVKMEPAPLGITRELARELVRLFPESVEAKAVEAKKRRKPIVQLPDTTRTGVTVRDLDMWEDEDHGNPTD